MILEAAHPRSYPRLRSRRLTMRLYEDQEIAAVMDYYRRNAEFLTPWEPRRPPDFLTDGYWRRFQGRSREEFEADMALRLFLFPHSEPRRVIGYVGMFNFVRGAGHFCTIGYSLDEQAQGQGLMGEALKHVIQYAFKELGMHKIMANYMPHNVRSGRLLRRLGFVVEGFSRDFLLINGRWEDHVMTSLTNPDWKPL
jgi:ribosomal-protein-alanine N-acetyltransferase